TGTVTLSGAAPSGGAVVNLSSSAPAATVPSSVTVIAGYTSETFTVNTTTVTASTPVTITASYAGVSKTASLTIMPPATAGTPAGSYTLTVTGTSSGVSRSTTVQVVVNEEASAPGLPGPAYKPSGFPEPILTGHLADDAHGR